MEIERLYVITGQGVSSHFANDDTEIKEANYSVCGDSYPCFHVIRKGKIIAEIRCVHAVEIYYKEKP